MAVISFWTEALHVSSLMRRWDLGWDTREVVRSGPGSGRKSGSGCRLTPHYIAGSGKLVRLMLLATGGWWWWCFQMASGVSGGVGVSRHGPQPPPQVYESWKIVSGLIQGLSQQHFGTPCYPYVLCIVCFFGSQLASTCFIPHFCVFWCPQVTCPLFLYVS